MPRVALIPGDGIGVEVVREARRLLEALNAPEGLGLELVDWDLGAERYLREGVTITDEEFAGTTDEVAIGEDVNTRKGVAGIIPGRNALVEPVHGSAPDIAGRGTANPIGAIRCVSLMLDHFGHSDLPRTARVALIPGDGIGVEVVREARRLLEALNAPEGLGLELVDWDLGAERYLREGVTITDEEFAGTTDEVAIGEDVNTRKGVAGIIPGRNALVEPVHGSAPDIAGRGTANPIGAIRCVSLMLDHFGHSDLGERVEAAVAASVEAGRTTPDLGGKHSTEDVGQWIIAHVAGVHAASD